jgi:hypothetical protein
VVTPILLDGRFTDSDAWQQMGKGQPRTATLPADCHGSHNWMTGEGRRGNIHNAD